jgi:hypothetical protein
MVYPKSVRYISDYKLEIGFSDGLRGVVDLEAELYGPMFGPLKNIELFRQAIADPDIHTIVWPNGADLAPEFLYELALESSGKSMEENRHMVAR